MAKVSDLTEWGFIPPETSENDEPRRRRSPFTVVDESGREITVAVALDDGEDDPLKPPREPLPWGLISLGLLGAAGVVAALAAAWIRPPVLASTPALEMAPRSDEASEIWTQEAVSFDALARARAAIRPADEGSTPDDAKLQPGSNGASIAAQAESVPTPRTVQTPSAVETQRAVETPKAPEAPNASEKPAPLESGSPVAPETRRTDSDNPY